MEVRDLWPESIKTVGAMKDNLFIRYFEWEEMCCYRSAKTIVVVTDSFKRTLTARGIDEAKIKVVKNGVDKEMLKPVPKDEALIGELGLEGKKIIVIANLKPNRICNVNSQGMLLAATNNACGCKVIFVDDMIPCGTQIK